MEYENTLQFSYHIPNALLAWKWDYKLKDIWQIVLEQEFGCGGISQHFIDAHT